MVRASSPIVSREEHKDSRGSQIKRQKSDPKNPIAVYKSPLFLANELVYKNRNSPLRLLSSASPVSRRSSKPKDTDSKNKVAAKMQDLIEPELKLSGSFSDLSQMDEEKKDGSNSAMVQLNDLT